MICEVRFACMVCLCAYEVVRLRVWCMHVRMQCVCACGGGGVCVYIMCLHVWFMVCA